MAHGRKARKAGLLVNAGGRTAVGRYATSGSGRCRAGSRRKSQTARRHRLISAWLEFPVAIMFDHHVKDREFRERHHQRIGGDRGSQLHPRVGGDHHHITSHRRVSSIDDARAIHPRQHASRSDAAGSRSRGAVRVGGSHSHGRPVYDIDTIPDAPGTHGSD